MEPPTCPENLSQSSLCINVTTRPGFYSGIYIYMLWGGGVDSPRVSHDDHGMFEQIVVRSLSKIQALQSM